MKQTWKIVWLLALKVTSPTQIMPDELGLVFTYSTRCITNYRIELANLKELTISLMIKAKKQLQDLLPSRTSKSLMYNSCTSVDPP
jgi:hypothetical protein